MDSRTLEIINRLDETHSLSKDEYLHLIENRSEESTALLRERACARREIIFGNKVFIRGLIEFTNICRNDCLYCGIRKSNSCCTRYRLTLEQILQCTESGYKAGFRTFVLQGGEDPFFDDEKMCSIIKAIKQQHPDCALTLSIGERSEESYRALFNAGADRYLLRHETATESHYRKLHPESMSFSNRMNCLKVLRKTGFATGAGFMIGSPFQTVENLAEDLLFIEKFQPEMCGIGPFISHKDTPFAGYAAGSADLCCHLLSMIRLIKNDILLPATTALGTILKNGRELGIQSGANVVMPNLSPVAVRKNYMLYDNKLFTDEESAQNLARLKESMDSIGFKIVTDRGDPPSMKKSE